MNLAEHVPLAPLTTLGVGGPARWFVEATSEAEVAEALAWANARAVPTLVLGGGSNLLVADRGFDGLVLRARIRGVAMEDGEVEAGAGEVWDELVARTVASGWAGIECLSGIPGDVGATPIQNVGAYGQEVAETIVRVRAVERATGATVTLDAARCGFGYRDSVFKREDAGRFVIVAVRFALRPGGAPSLRYAELAKWLSTRATPTLAGVRQTVIELRRGKSMVLDPSDENGKSAGSFFMNPTLDAEAFAVAQARVAAAGVLRAGEEMPSYPAGARVKLSAAWLIERAGFHKGMHDGAVGISTRHTLAIVNRGGATAAEVVAFARRVHEGVLARFGVALTPEPVMVGFTPEELVPKLTGEGGMGRVRRDYETRLQRQVAIKELHPAEGGEAADNVASALREARAVEGIAHPNAAAVYDADTFDGVPFIVMELVPGTSLRQIISGSPVPMRLRLRWLVDIAGALSAAHHVGVVHGDIRPENVRVRDDGLVKVLDFGMAPRARLARSDSHPGEEASTPDSGGRLVGTPAYMSPEQLRGEPTDGRADQFAWGVLAYELLTGRLPWKTAREFLGYIAAVLTERPEPPRTHVPEIPAQVEAAILRALAKNAADRFVSIAAAAAELAPFTQGE